MRAATIIALAAFSSTPGPSPLPQDAEKPTSTGFVLEAGEHHLREILVAAAKYFGRNYILPEQELANDSLRIELQKSLNLDATGCEEVVSQLAFCRDFAIVPMDPLRGLYEVVFLRGARRPIAATRALQLTPDEVLRRARMKVQVLTLIPLQHIDATRASQQLRPFFAGAGQGGNVMQFGNAGGSDSLLVHGWADEVAAAIQLLRAADRPEAAKSMWSDFREGLAAMSTQLTEQKKAIDSLGKRVQQLEGGGDSPSDKR